MTVSETALALGVSRQRVQQLIYTGVLPARRHGASWYIEADDCEVVALGRRRVAAGMTFYEPKYPRNPCGVCGAPMLGSHYHESEDIELADCQRVKDARRAK